MESPSRSPLTRGEEDDDILLEHEDFLDPLEERVFTAVQDLMDELSEDQVVTNLNIIAERLEDAENNFRKDRSPPYRREGHVVGNLLRLLDQFEDFYPMLERKLSIVTPNRVKAAACRVLLATVPANSRFIIRILYEEEILDNICEWSCESEAALRCYSTGLLSVGLRDRSIADIVVNKDTPITFLKRARLYASKLEKERQLAVKYMQDRARNSTSKQKKLSVSAVASGKSTSRTNASTIVGLKRKLSGGAEKMSVEADGSSIVEGAVNSEENINSPMARQEDVQFSDVSESLATLPDPNCHEEELKKLVMLELLYTLDCIGSLGEYLELFAPALKEDIVGTIITFLHSKNPTVLAHSMKLTSHFLAHKKFALSMIDAGGVELILASYHLTSALVGSQLHRSISMCLHGFASSSAVMEKILYLDGETLLNVAFGLLSSPNDRARQNAVVFFGLTIPFKAVMDFFEKQNGLYTLLNIIRAGNHPRSSAQRQLSHDACLCLRQYLRVQVALVAHRLRRKLSQLHYHPFSSTSAPPAIPGGRKSRLSARVPKLSALKPLDIDDKVHEQNLIFFEKYRFSAGNFGTGHEMWPPAARLSHLRGILVMLEVIAMGCTIVHGDDAEDASSSLRLWLVERAQFCLESLRILTLVAPSVAPEVCATEVSSSFRENDDEAEEEDQLVSPNKKKVGVSLLLEIATSSNARDADLIREALHVLCNCVSPPHGEDCWQHPYKDLRQFTLTARSQRRYTPTEENLQDHVQQQVQQGNVSGEKLASVVSASNFVCCAKAKDDKALRPVRKLAREKNAIKVCVQLLRYKRSVQNADAVRLLATRVLLGLARDRQIAQILEKMQIGQLLSDLIRLEPVLEENADLHVRFRECAMDLISLVTHRAPNAVINEAADPTVRKIEKASIVAQTKITYDSQELLRIIHEHLVSRGLDKAADVLAKEADLVDHHPETQHHPSVESVHSPNAAKMTKSLLPSTDISSVMHPEGEPRALKIRRLHHSVDSEVKSPRGPSPHTQTQSSQLGISIPLAHSLRKKQIKKALMSPNLFERSDIKQAEGIGQKQHLRPKSFSSSDHSSKLDEIITHYLREQHRHCANPVTTVPPFKLSNAESLHRCPDPPSTNSLNVNIYKRLATRNFMRNAAQWSFSAASSDTIINRYVFSRYRAYRVVGSHGASYWGGMCSSQFLGVNQLLTGNYNAEIRLWNLDSDSVVEEWTCHDGSLPIVDLQTNGHTRLGTQSSLFISGTAGYMPYEHSEIALWDLKNMTSARWRFDGRSPRFNPYGDRVVALDIRMHDNEDWETRSESGRCNVNGAVLLDVATGEVLAELKDNSFANGYGAETNCVFANCDTIVLTDGVLWDVRMSTPRAVHKFDKLSNSGFGDFHPNGNEVLVNSAVWDLRTYRLLRMVPSLDKCNLMFNNSGNAIYAYHAYGAGGGYLDHRKSRLKSWFRVLDARDYRDVTTVELERPIYNLSIDPKSMRLSVVEGRYADSQEDDDPVCRLYEIGRKRPSEDDSDVEDAHDDSDTLDDDEFDDESEESSHEDDDDGDDESESGLSTSDEEGDFESDEFVDHEEESGVEVDEDENEEESDGDENEDFTRGIRFLFEIPEGAYYDMHGQYSSEEEDVDED